MKILSLSSVFPNPSESGLGLFVRARLSAITGFAQVKVIAPLPLLDYTNPKGKIYRRRMFPFTGMDGPIEVLFPRWVFPPLGTPLNVICLFLRLQPMVRDLRARFDFDLIDAHFGYPEGIVAALLAWAFNVPFTITLRGSEPIFNRYRYRRQAMRWAFRRVSRIIAVSEELRRFAISHGVAAEKVVTIPNGIDQSIFHPRNRTRSREKYGISPNRKAIVSAGEFIQAKGHQDVAQAVRELVAEGVDAELLIVGTTARGGPNYETTLKRFVRNLHLGDRIRFVGWAGREEMAELLSAADVFCLASYTEGWPNVVHEAQACGAPVVATRVGAIPEMIPSTEYGLIVPVKDVPALVRALRAALVMTDWDRRKIALWGGSRSWSHVAQEVGDIFTSVIRERTPPETRADESAIRIGGV
jgi:glycosyltransferase involved in cell wall biosynthesis